MDPTFASRYMVLSPSSTYVLTSCSWSLLKVLLLEVTCLEAPLSTYHSMPEMVLDERHETMDKCVSILGESSSTLADASVLLANFFGACCPPPSHDIEKHSGETSETWNTYVAQVLLSLIRETWILFLPFLTLLSLLLLHSADEGKLLLLYLRHCPVLSSSGWTLPIASQRWKAFLRHRTIGQKDSKKKRTHLRP